MKKFLATILSVILLLTIMPVAYAEESDYKVGDIIQFGSYPQTEVKDEALITELNSLAPQWDDWTSYGYYSGTGDSMGHPDWGSMMKGDWMRYIDVTYNGSKYRGIKFTQCRPMHTAIASSESNTYQYDNGYNINIMYWFKFESIKWRVLDPSTRLVMCETIIDSQPYSNTIYYDSSADDWEYAYFNDSSYTNYASDYETSSIRKWLNEDFYNTAFTDSEKKEISTTTLNNDGYYTSNGTTGYEALDSNETSDKIFLLSHNELRNSNFGFNSNSLDYDTARRAQGSDYAQSQGLCVYVDSDSAYNGNSYWLLRSPGDFSISCCYVSPHGYSYFNDDSINITFIGVRPALKLNQISGIDQSEHEHAYTLEITKVATHHEEGVRTYTCSCGDTYTESISKLDGHTYISKVTAKPTCTKEGAKTYTCSCGDSYTETIPATGHKDTNGDYKCDNGCGYEYEKPAPEEPTDKNCSHLCHKSGFMGFIWKIINFFQKLFRMNPVCECGAAHY